MRRLGLALKPQLCMHISKRVEGGSNSLEGRYLQTVSYTKAWLNKIFVGRTVLDKTRRIICLLIAVLNVMGCNL
jgi:hypothetical protein